LGILNSEGRDEVAKNEKKKPSKKPEGKKASAKNAEPKSKPADVEVLPPETKIVKASKVKMPKEDIMPVAQARQLRDGIIQDFKSAEGSLVAAAIKLDAFTRGVGWKALGYETMTEWRETEIKSTEFFRLRNVNRLLEAGVPVASVEKMKLTNIDVLVRQLPEKEWKKADWQKAAAELPVADFEKRATAEAEDFGTIQEQIERRGFAGPTSLIEQWDLALKVAEAVEGAQKLEARIETIVACYLNSDSQTEGRTKLQRYHELSNID
jgi:hypothetical protein